MRIHQCHTYIIYSAILTHTSKPRTSTHIYIRRNHTYDGFMPTYWKQSLYMSYDCIIVHRNHRQTTYVHRNTNAHVYTSHYYNIWVYTALKTHTCRHHNNIKRNVDVTIIYNNTYSRHHTTKNDVYVTIITQHSIPGS